MKLYLVKLVGLTDSSGIRCNPSYVLASNPDEAYQKVRSHLDKKDYGFTKERELHSVTLIAENKEYPDCGAMLFT